MATYKETLDYLFAQLPMYHRVGAAAFKKDLTNTLALCAHLDNPHQQFPSIHVAGTNGKGSVSHILAAICQAAGLKTGLYISPHYKDFRERIKINGTYIPQRRVIDFVENNRSIIEAIQPSFFEMTVAMAFDHFAREKVDIAIIEVGLGGRLDSTNVITPLLSVITNISFDHVAMLGDTLPKIAFEKAGIIKPGVPVVIGEAHPETLPVFEEKALAENAQLVVASEHYYAEAVAPKTPETNAQATEHQWNTTFFNVFRDGQLRFENIPVGLGGPYQAKNLATALQAVEVLQQMPHFPKNALTQSAVLEGLSNLRPLTRFIGRWQVIGENPTVLCDSAHNEAGIQSAFARINTLNFNQLHIVTGFVNDKDVSGVLAYFPQNARYYFAKANIPRGLAANVLQEKAAPFGLNGKCYTSVRNALKAARRAAQPDDLVVVIGSIFVVGEVL